MEPKGVKKSWMSRRGKLMGRGEKMHAVQMRTKKRRAVSSKEIFSWTDVGEARAGVLILSSDSVSINMQHQLY